MLRRIVLAIFVVVPLLGCSRSTPSTTANPAIEKPMPRLELVSYLEPDKSVHGFLCRPGGEGPYPALLMIHDRMGLTDGIKDQTFRLARAGYVVLAVDLYRGAVAKSAKEAKRLEDELSKERALHDLKSAVDYLTRRSDVRPPSPVATEKGKESWDVGVIGLGMGGRYAFDAALRDPRLRALVLCYCPLPTDAKQLKPLKASVFCVLAGKDKRVSVKTIPKFTEAMQQAGKKVEGIRVYGAEQAGFLDPATWQAYGNPAEDERKDKKKDEEKKAIPTTRIKGSENQWENDVEDAWKLILEYLSKVLK